MAMARRAYLALALIEGSVALLSCAPALADNPWKQSSTLWHIMDKCTRAAQKQFPDHTPDANAKRDAARRHCMESYNLPTDGPPQPADDRR